MTQQFIPRRTLLFFAGIVVVLCATIAWEAWRQHLLQGAEEAAKASIEGIITEQTKIHCQIFYPRCGHNIKENPLAGHGFEGLGTEELAVLGWQLVWQEGEAYLSRESEGFCPTDSQKRHLALLHEHLCIYTGPLGGGGELLQQLDIPLQAIPARWLAQLTNGGIEFATEENLLMALDNLDELVEEWREVIALPGY